MYKNIEFDEIINRYNTNSAKWDNRDIKSKDITYLDVADMDFKSPIEIRNKMKNIVEHGIFGYSILTDDYYNSIAYWYEKRHDFKIHKEWIKYSPRIGISISLIIQNLTEIGDSVVVQTPVYPMFYEAILKNEREIIENPLILKEGKYIIDFEDLKNKVNKKTKVFILCNPHNPTGKVYTKLELEKIVEFCYENNIILIADEVHCDIVYKPHKHIPIISVSDKAKEISIICSSITKTFNVPGVITSHMIIPNIVLRKKIEKILDKNIIHNPNIFGVGITSVAYNECEYWLEKALEYIEENRKYLKEYISKYIRGIKYEKANSTYFAWLDYRNLNISEKKLDELLKKEKFVIYMGSHFGKDGLGFIRVNLATPKENIIKFLEALKKICLNLEG
ncbi:MalY/PatB family protein [Oceanivirga salmonicida]|uniref:MalY/PatB family protein n=1 Tax=Oceanivirga salmonicida TaxID=1769291 RepID=UPI0012E24C04|nr:MalY/PatB family protein [Oceanivirga salmonicida]